MDNISRSSLFEITELVHLVGQHLTQHEIVQCMQVSKQFALQFEPMLWEHLDFNKKTPPSTEASFRNFIHIRSVSLGPQNIFKNLKLLTHGLHRPDEASHAIESTPKEDSTTCTVLPIVASDLPMSSMSLCTNLTRIYSNPLFGTERDTEAMVDYLTLLRHNPGLRSLILSSIMLKSYMQPLLEVISNLTCIENISLHNCAIYAPLETTLPVLRTCLKLPRLSRLKMNYSIDGIESEQQAFDELIPQVLDEALTARRMGTVDGAVEYKVRELVLPFIRNGYSISSLSAILQSELLALETFTVPLINKRDLQGSLDVLGNAVRQHCTRIQHLVIPSRGYGCDNSKVDGTVIRECSGGLRSIRGTYMGDYSYRPGTESFLWAAATHQWKTLEEIELLSCTENLSMDIQNALESCTKLRRFWDMPLSFFETSLDMDDVVRGKDWGCLEMKEFYLKLRRNESRSKDVATRNGKETKVFAGAQRLYEQIGRLVDLEILVLHIIASTGGRETCDKDDFSWDLTLSRGCLRSLSGLKKLRELSFKGDFYSKMGQAEVEFIDAEWPRLEQIDFGHDCTTMADNEHWKWLKEQRPGLRYINV